MSQAIFSLKELTLAGSDVPRLKSVTLQISCGITAVVGLSGAGKTSLLNVLAGFETEFSGELTSQVPVEGGNRLPLFWVPQSGGLWPHLTAKQHLDIVGDEVAQRKMDTKSGQVLCETIKSGWPGLEGASPKPRGFLRYAQSSPGHPNLILGVDKAQVPKRTDEFLSLFDLNHRQRALPAELSQGERSRLALARALAARANILLLDEPLSHVDPVRKPDYWRIVRQIVAEENTSMVFTSHEPETVLRHAEHVICLRNGSVVFDGAVRTLYEDPPNAQIGAFLGPLNWFHADEVAAFLAGHEDSAADVGIRPERLRIHLQEDSLIEVMSQPFSGMYTETVVKHQTTQTVKTILHQSSDVPLRIGDRVAFRIPSSAGDKS